MRMSHANSMNNMRAPSVQVLPSSTARELSPPSFAVQRRSHREAQADLSPNYAMTRTRSGPGVGQKQWAFPQQALVQSGPWV